jgi:hypothetical protein
VAAHPAHENFIKDMAMGYLKCDDCKSWYNAGTGICKCRAGAPKAPAGPVAVLSVHSAPKPIVSPPRVVAPPRVVTPSVASGSGVARSSVQDELERIRLEAAERRGGPANFAGKYAYRGVGSSPSVYEQRGGFASHRIATIDLARSTLQSLANKDDGLSQSAFRWQERKDKADGYFLSTGLSEVDSYDNYDYLYRINIGGLVKRSWEGFTVTAEAVKDCVLYTDNANIAAATMIAIICLKGGVGRSYELLIMSPVPPALCQVAHPKGFKTYVSFDEWKRLTSRSSS